MADIEALKAQHGKIFSLEVAGETFIAKNPSRDVWKRFRAQIMDEGKRVIAPENLVRSCIIDPPTDALDALLEQKPGLVESLSKALAESAGATGDAEKKAL